MELSDQYWQDILFGYRTDYRLYKNKKVVMNISAGECLTTLTVYKFNPNERDWDETHISEYAFHKYVKESKEIVFEETFASKDLLTVQLKGLVEAKKIGWDIKMIFDISKTKDVIGIDNWNKIEV